MQKIDSRNKTTGAYNVPIYMWTDGLEIEESARQQLIEVSNLPFVAPHISVMPDVHWGMGATVGSVIPTQGAIVPAAVGVDIGCGMMAQKLPVNINAFQDLPKLRSSIERSIPVGFSQHREPIDSFEGGMRPLFVEKKLFEKSQCQLGTLGGGNHFIELCYDEDNWAWVMLHSGSRNIGKSLAEIYINKAKDICKEYFISLPNPDLAYLVQDKDDFIDYMHALTWCQQYALKNREVMMRLILKDINHHLYGQGIVMELIDKPINCHHNFTRQENHFGKNLWITRKGAVSAREGELGIIPGSMGNKSYIVKGKGNALSFHSCSHGAGRALSRNSAKKMYTVEDHIKATEGVECKKDESVLDETPMAYKPIDKVMEAQGDLVEIVHTLKQVMCIKG